MTEKKTKIKIGYDAKRIVRNGTGLGSYGRTLINSLSIIDKDDDFLLYAPDCGKDELRNQIEPHDNIRFVYPKKSITSFPLLSAIQKSAWRSKGMVKDMLIDGVTLFHGLSGELPVGLHKAGIKSVLTIHDLIFLRHPEYYNPLDVMIYKKKFHASLREADRIIAISECTKRDILYYGDFPEDRIDVIYQSCSMRFEATATDNEKKRVIEKYNLPNDYILNIGTIEERKNVLLAVKALEKLRSDLHLIIIGRWTKYTDKVMEYVKQHNLSERVHILSGVPNEDLYPICQQAQCFVYPSRYEGFGIPIIEAIQSGLPVVAATGSCLEEAGGPACLYVSPDDDAEMAKSVEKVITERKERVEKCKEYISKFENGDVARQVIEVYNKVLLVNK